ncbi:thiol S-methyltransferase METTL7B-like [Daphnia pulicaria]|uniref:thiol S-methyltransferase METTL7B-like n=1 Tax=Daphnia pulicaria TaxID=35523 RepID=UPI001EEB3EF1|nr:thiol S-methyltransferase METTL7B-like [Daphnia pulicaria]
MFEEIADIALVFKPWISHLVTLLTVLLILRKYGGSHLQPWFLSKVYTPMLAIHHNSIRDLQRKHFEMIKNHKSADPELRKKGILRILEIGPGPGYNFAFYPPKSQLSVVEVNPFFEKQFFKKQADHPHINMERFIVGFAEDMKGVESDSFDVVVSSCVLCSVRNAEKSLKEVHRVLAPGGKYFYWEHIRDFEYGWVAFIQDLFTYTFHDLVFGCCLNRTSDQVIAANKCGFSKIEQQRIKTPLKKGFHSLYIIVASVVIGIATK